MVTRANLGPTLGRALIAALSLLVAAPADGLAREGRQPSVSALSVLLIDANGEILYAKNADDTHAPASLVKMMTLYLALEDIEAGRARWDDVVVVSKHAARRPRYRMGLRSGEQVPLETLLHGVGIASANDAASAVAEHLSNGDEQAFVDRMNRKAQDLGLGHTSFANPHGLPDPSQRSTARDLVELISRLVHDHPASRTILGGQTFVFRGRVYGRSIPFFSNPGGVEALKTGFTNEAGYNLAVTTWRADRQFLVVVLGARTRGLSFTEARKVLRFGFVKAGLEEESPRPRKGGRFQARSKAGGAART